VCTTQRKNISSFVLADAAANGAKTKGLKSSRMSPEEAAQILNIKLPAKQQEIDEVRWSNNLLATTSLDSLALFALFSTVLDVKFQATFSAISRTCCF
jgi:hypothetical protein